MIRKLLDMTVWLLPFVTWSVFFGSDLSLTACALLGLCYGWSHFLGFGAGAAHMMRTLREHVKETIDAAKAVVEHAEAKRL